MIKKIFFPQFCPICKEESSLPLCEKCLNSKLNLKLSKSNYNCTYIDKLFYFVDFKGHNKIIVKMGKYKFNKRILKIIGEKMGENLKLEENSVISFIPLSWARYCYRGFNQAEVLARSISKSKTVKLLKRISFAGSLTKLDQSNRKKAASLAFGLNKKALEIPKNVKTCYLVDDVYTSGATLNAAAKILKESYPRLNVIGLCFAKTPKLYT